MAKIEVIPRGDGTIKIRCGDAEVELGVAQAVTPVATRPPLPDPSSIPVYGFRHFDGVLGQLDVEAIVASLEEETSASTSIEPVNVLISADVLDIRDVVRLSDMMDRVGVNVTCTVCLNREQAQQWSVSAGVAIGDG